MKNRLLACGAMESPAPIYHQSITNMSGYPDVKYRGYLNAIEMMALIQLKERGLAEKEIINGGGYLYLDQSSIIAEYPIFNSREFVASSSYDATNDKRVLVELNKSGIKAIIYDPTANKTLPFNPNINKFAKGKGCMNAEAVLFAGIAYAFKCEKTDSSCHEVYEKINKVCLYNADAQEHVAYLLEAYEHMDKALDNDCFSAIFANLKQQMPSSVEKVKKFEDMVSYGDMYGYRVFIGEIESEQIPAQRDHKLRNIYGLYDFCPERERTAEEKEIIETMKRKINPDMEVSDDIIDIAVEIQKSTNLPFKFRNYMLKGPTGTGKTTAVCVLGLLLNLPVVTFSCDPDTDQLALGVSIVPDAKKDDAGSIDEFINSLPNDEDLMFSPEETFEKYTGEKKENVSIKDCIGAILKKFSTDVQNPGGFRYVYSSIAKAMKYGWIVEVQEPTVIQRPGVLTALNSLTDDCATMDLANGEKIERHPDAIMVYTTNLNCEGCYEMNQSQKSRMSQRTINLPDEEVIVNRLCKSTNYSDFATAKKMVKVYMAATKYAESRSITDGAIDFRALQEWATVNQIFPSRVYENGLVHFIEKCTEDAVQKALFVTNCLETQFKPKSVAKEENAMRNLRR